MLLLGVAAIEARAKLFRQSRENPLRLACKSPVLENISGEGSSQKIGLVWEEVGGRHHPSTPLRRRVGLG
jgi:hypothetical protein